MGHKGHWGEYTGNAKWSKVTNSNMGATKRDDEAHMEYLKEDIDYDNKHGHSDSSMTSDEKHISKLAGDLKYDEKKHGSAAKMVSPFNRRPTQAEEKTMNEMLFNAGDTNSEAGKAMVAKIKTMEDRIASEERKPDSSPANKEGGKSAHTKSTSQKADFAWEGHKQLAHHKVKLGQITSKPSEKEIREMSDKNIN